MQNYFILSLASPDGNSKTIDFQVTEYDLRINVSFEVKLSDAFYEMGEHIDNCHI